MLGRQQIAGIQNALAELFKNAHDAYASHVVADYFEEGGPGDSGFIVIRDNGVGMTKLDFEDKWLVLGTESKTEEQRSKIYRPRDVQVRSITGEKGIGRLAIALLGRVMLVLTRAEREDGLHDLVAAVIHWGLFEVPGLALDEVEIPVKTFPKDQIPSQEDVIELCKKLCQCAENIRKLHTDSFLDDVIRDIENFEPDPASFDAFFAARDSENLSLLNGGRGTHFFIGPCNPSIRAELVKEEKDGDYGFRKQLLGFYDSVFGKLESPLISASFRRWRPGDLIGEDLLDPNFFFTREDESKRSDHWLEGIVDDYGQFSGNLRVYENYYPGLSIPWGENRGARTKCGEFSVKFGYVMGNPSESMVKADEFKKINTKLDFIGGIYVYRDGVRILPYGDPMFDWLEIEKRRNKGAGYYFFAYRRMFGAIQLSRENNSDLVEKAGREGFQSNEAYRQFREILINILLNLTAEFFRRGGSNTEIFEQVQADFRKRSAALEKQQKQSATKRKNFANALGSFVNEVETGLPESAIANLRKLTHSRMEAASVIADQDKAAAALIRAEREAVAKLGELRNNYTCKKPSGVALTKALAREWEGYLATKDRLESELFKPFENEIASTLGEVANQARIYVDQRKRLEDRIRSLADDRKKELAEVSKQANATAIDTRQTVFQITEKARFALDQAIRNIQTDLNRTDLNAMSPVQIEELRMKWEEELTDIEARHRDALIAAKDMLASLAENLRGSDGEEPAQIMEALEQRMMALEEQADEDFEMVQLGLAVAIINHEFAASIKSVRRSIQDLGQISRTSSGLKPLYESIRHNFEHLDGHLNLFTPLQRRLHRNAQRIDGPKIRNYVLDVFQNRIERHKFNIECTDGFLSAKIECYPSTLYPAVINLIDNAMYWLSNIKGNRSIRLDADSEGIVVSNNGPEIDPRDAERIFERGFSRRPSGRGLGLFISAKALQAESMNLSLGKPPLGHHVAFKITIPNIKVDL